MSESGPTFLVGAQRSGTTAMGVALARAFASRGLCFTVNGRLPYLLHRWWTQMDADALHLRGDEVVALLRRKPPIGPDAEEWVNRAIVSVTDMTAFAANNRVDALNAIRDACGQAYKTCQWGDKYNEYLLEIPWLTEVFPTARWIFLFRSPGSVVSSMQNWDKTKIWNPTAASQASQKWVYWNSMWLRHRERIPESRRIELQYEEICKGRIEKLSYFVGIDMEAHMRDYRHISDSSVHQENLDQEAVSLYSRLVGLTET